VSAPMRSADGAGLRPKAVRQFRPGCGRGEWLEVEFMESKLLR
jgi:hypothetical protein